jgi:anti-anti-sigma factor
VPLRRDAREPEWSVVTAPAPTGTRSRPSPRFSGRRYRTRGWPCPRPSAFSILVVHARDDVLLQLSGRLDAVGSQAFDECVDASIAERPRRLVVDCSGLDTLEHKSAGSFVRAQQRADDADIACLLEAPNHDVQRVLREAASYETFSVR